MRFAKEDVVTLRAGVRGALGEKIHGGVHSFVFGERLLPAVLAVVRITRSRRRQASRTVYLTAALSPDRCLCMSADICFCGGGATLSLAWNFVLEFGN